MMVQCGSCRHQWFADLGLPAPLLEAAKRINRLRCPMCETPSDRIFIVAKSSGEAGGPQPPRAPSESDPNFGY